MQEEADMPMEPRRRLGRGLDALLGAYPGDLGDRSADAAPGRRAVPVALIDRNPRNPRRDFRVEDLEELAASIRQHGIVQPIVVRPVAGAVERYEIIAGERRWRAAQLAGLHEAPVVVLDVSDRQALELAIVENVQRADLNPVDEARGYQALIEEFGYSHGDLGSTIGKSRVHIANTLRLLKLPPPLLAFVEAGTLSAGHGRALLSARDPGRLAATVLDRNLSVRETERLAQLPDQEPRAKPSRKAATKSAEVRVVEKELADRLGLEVDLRHDDSGRGELRIRYRDLEQLEEICRRLRG